MAHRAPDNSGVTQGGHDAVPHADGIFRKFGENDFPSNRHFRHGSNEGLPAHPLALTDVGSKGVGGWRPTVFGKSQGTLSPVLPTTYGSKS